MYVLPTFLLGLAALTAAKPASYQAICQRKSANTQSGTYNAIQTFCGHGDFDYTSSYASRGVINKGNGVGAHVFLSTHSCQPGLSHTMPKDYCYLFFYAACAKGDKKGFGLSCWAAYPIERIAAYGYH
nr:hypothetical protein B0A51_00373 [Rachicladosporium sp. CCFEE 5018]